MQGEINNHQRSVVSLQSEVQYQVSRAQSFQATLETMQAQPQIDPGLYAELEALRALKMNLESEKINLEAECGSLHGRLGKQQEEARDLQQRFNKKNNDLEEAKNSIKKLNDKLTNLEKKNSSENGQVEVREGLKLCVLLMITLQNS